MSWSRAWRAAFSAWIIFVWSGLDQVLAETAMEEQANKAAVFAAKVEKSMTALEDGLRDAPRDRWDPQYVVDNVGIEQKALFDWVRQNVGWVPYRGALRGPVGVLMDRSGNSLDQALLLAELLKLAGYQVRIAHGELSPEIAGSVWQQMLDAEAAWADYAAEVEAEATATDTSAGAQAEPQTASQPAEQANVQVVAESYGIDPQGAEQGLETAAAEGMALNDGLVGRTLTQAPFLMSMLQRPDGGAEQKAAQDAALAGLRDHWWVQVSNGGTWTSLDIFAGEEIGKELVPAATTFAPESLPPENTHRIKLRVVSEIWKAGKTEEHTVIEHDFVPADLIGKRIALRAMPMDWPANFTSISSDEVQNRLFAALATQREWMPILDVGDQQFTQFSVIDTGAINEKPDPSKNPFLAIGVPAGGVMGQVGDVIGGIMDSTEEGGDAQPTDVDPALPKRESEFTAEWLEFQLFTPGEAQPRVVRREVFDLIGPAKRAKGDVSGVAVTADQALERSRSQMMETELLILPCKLAPEFVEYLTAQVIVANRPFVDDMGTDPFGAAPKNSVEMFAKMKPSPGPAYIYSALRFATGLSGDDVFVDRPMIVAQHGFLERASPGELVVKVGLDIVTNEVGVKPTATNAFLQRLAQGVIDTNAEAMALKKAWPTPQNTSQTLVATGPVPEKWALIKPGEEAKLDTLEVDKETAARIRSDLAAGQVALVAKGSVAKTLGAGYWRIDPKTGNTLGIGRHGWGAAIVEYAFVLLIQALLSFIACTAFTAAAKANAAKHGEVLNADPEQCKREALLGLISGLVATSAMAGFQAWRAGRLARLSPPKGSLPPGRGNPNAGNFGAGSGNGARPASASPPPGSSPPRGSPPPGRNGPAGNAPPGNSPPRGSPPPGNSPPRGSPPPGPARNTPKSQGPFQSDPYGREQVRQNESYAKETIGPIERIDQADAQAKKTYDHMRERGLDDAGARKWSEESWWDSYKNYHNRQNPGAAPRGDFGPPSPLYEPGESSGPPPPSSSGSPKSSMANSISPDAPQGRPQVTPPGQSNSGVNPFGQTQNQLANPSGSKVQVTPQGSNSSGLNPFGQTQAPGPNGTGTSGNTQVMSGGQSGSSTAGQGTGQPSGSAGVNPFGQTQNQSANPGGSKVQVTPAGTDRTGFNPFEATNPGLQVGTGGFIDALGGGQQGRK